jgi:hypothetical protein
MQINIRIQNKIQNKKHMVKIEKITLLCNDNEETSIDKSSWNFLPTPNKKNVKIWEEEIYSGWIRKKLTHRTHCTIHMTPTSTYRIMEGETYEKHLFDEFVNMLNEAIKNNNEYKKPTDTTWKQIKEKYETVVADGTRTEG